MNNENISFAKNISERIERMMNELKLNFLSVAFFNH